AVDSINERAQAGSEQVRIRTTQKDLRDGNVHGRIARDAQAESDRRVGIGGHMERDQKSRVIDVEIHDVTGAVGKVVLVKAPGMSNMLVTILPAVVMVPEIPGWQSQIPAPKTAIVYRTKSEMRRIMGNYGVSQTIHDRPKPVTERIVVRLLVYGLSLSRLPALQAGAVRGLCARR